MIRLLIVGETGVGKTSLLVRFNEGNFYSDQKTTIGVDYKAKEIEIDGEIVKLQVRYLLCTSINCFVFTRFTFVFIEFCCSDMGYRWSRAFPIDDICILWKSTGCCNSI